jgi:hypothetical protein
MKGATKIFEQFFTNCEGNFYGEFHLAKKQ